MAIPLVLYPGFIDKTHFSQILTPRAGTHRILLQSPHGPSLTFAWPSRGVLLMGAPGTCLLCLFTPWGLIKQIFPKYWPSPPVGQRGQQYPQLTLGPVLELWLRGRLPGGSELCLAEYPFRPSPRILLKLYKLDHLNEWFISLFFS